MVPRSLYGSYLHRFIPPKQSEGGILVFSLWFNFFSWIMGKCRDAQRASFTSFSAHTSKAGGLKFGRNNYHIDGSKFTNQIFDILSRS